MEKLKLFVYGTLKRGLPNHDRYCHGMLAVERGAVCRFLPDGRWE